MIRAALGEDHLIDAMDGRTYGAAQTSMLFAITHENGASAEDVDGLLAEAARPVMRLSRVHSSPVS